MMKKLFSKILTGVIAILVILTISGASLLIYELHLVNKYFETKLNISPDYLIKLWGKPDRDFICKSCNSNRVVIYRTLFTYYAFNFDEKSNVLIRKYVN